MLGFYKNNDFVYKLTVRVVCCFDEERKEQNRRDETRRELNCRNRG
jgi:hypothetical protein